MSLFQRAVAINVGVILAAVVLLAASPASVSPRLKLAEAAVLGIGAALMISVNLVLLRRVFGPLERLTALMERVDPRSPGRRLALDAGGREVARARERLQRDARPARGRAAQQRPAGARPRRRTSARRLARELHDEIGQTLTGVVLQLEGLAAPGAAARCGRPSPRRRRRPAAGWRTCARSRAGCGPQALDEFGLRSALVSLASQVTDRIGHAGAPRRSPSELPRARPPSRTSRSTASRRRASPTSPATRGARRGGAAARRRGGRARSSSWCATTGAASPPAEAAGGGSGPGGMRERALLIGALLDVDGAPGRRHRGAAA